MKSYLCVVVAMGIVGAGSYGQGAGSGPREPSAVVGAPAVVTGAASVKGTGPLAVAIYRGETVIGWVTPDPDRMLRAQAAPAQRAAEKAPSKVKAGERGSTHRSAAVRSAGSVSKIKAGFRKVVRKSFYRKPSWLKQSSNEFSDRGSRRKGSGR